MLEDSLASRYIFRLLSNLIKMALGVLALGLVPRALGPTNFGAFSFLTKFFATAIKFLKFGFAHAFFVKLSRRPTEKGLVGIYFYFIFLLSFTLFILTFLVINFGFKDYFWKSQSSFFIYVALFYSVLNLFFEFHQLTIDALGYTKKFQFKIILQSLLFFFFIVCAYFSKNLSLEVYFLIHYFSLIFIIGFSVRILNENKVFISRHLSLNKKKVIGYLREFFSYSHPLIINSIAVFIISLSDLWFLQFYYGSKEQGYYSFAMKISSLSFVFTGSITALILRDMSKKYKNKNIGEIKKIFEKYTPLLYSIAAFFGAFIFLNSKFLCTYIGGEMYIGSIPMLYVLSFFPIHQTYGQLTGNVFSAVENTKIIRNVSLITSLFGFLLTLFLILPIELNGLNLGGFGLSIKLVLIQILYVNILLYYAMKLLKISFVKYFFHQIIVASVFLFIAYLSQTLSSFIFHEKTISMFLVSGFIYSIASILLVLSFPISIFSSKKIIMTNFKNVIKYLNLYK